MSRFINCATRWSGNDWICPIMGNSCIFHWETNVCFGDGLGNRCNLRGLYVYLLFHWYAEHVWNQWERKTNISEENTCRMFPQTVFLGISQKLLKHKTAHINMHVQTWTHTHVFSSDKKNSFLLHLKKQKLGKKEILWGRLLRTFFRVDAVWVATVPETHWKFTLGTWMERERQDQRGKVAL